MVIPCVKAVAFASNGTPGGLMFFQMPGTSVGAPAGSVLFPFAHVGATKGPPSAAGITLPPIPAPPSVLLPPPAPVPPAIPMLPPTPLPPLAPDAPAVLIVEPVPDAPALFSIEAP